jgi:polysaccharide biosynthesis transport protein
MATEYELTLADYLSILKRRWLQLLVIFLVIFGVATTVAILLPPIYQSTGTILVESQQIPPDLVKATVTSYADERIEVIRQRVMTRDNLHRIIQKYGLFPDKIDTATTSSLIDIMRSSITVQLLNAEVQGGTKSKATIAFKVGFEYPKPDVAHKVANELVTLFLDENVKARTERATETTEFLTQEVDRLKAELENVENKVATFKQQNANALPEHLTMHMGMMQNTDSQIKELDREYKATQEELRYLDVELTSAKTASKNNGTPTQTVQSDLEKAKVELERALVLYKETHPTVRALKRKIETLEKSPSVVAAPQDNKSDIESDLVVAKVQAQIEAAKVRLGSIQEQKRSLEAKNAQLQAQVTQSPQVERGLFSLMRDYENAKAKYEEVKSKQINAKIAENLESENKAERFSLLEPPVFPDKPSKPDRKKIIAVGLFAALAGAIGIAALFEAMDKRVRGVDAMTALINMRPLVVIPYITTQNEAKRKIKLAKYAVIAVVVSLILGLILIHFLITPLDLLMVKLMSRFS